MKTAWVVLPLLLAAALPAPAQKCTPEFCEIPIETSSARPETNAVAGVSHGYRDAEAFAAFLRESAFGEAAAGRPARAETGKGGLLRLLLVFFAGLALNLSPCVLPMIPVQIAVLGMGRRAASRRDGAVRGCAYGGAVALTYGLLGLVAVRTGAAFGRIQSLPAFNFAIAGVFVLLALALLGVFPIDFSRLGRRVSGTLSLAGLVAMGATSALLAGACVAPAVIAVIVYAADSYAAGNSLALALPLLLGCGMAFPWPFVGAGLSVLPRPGGWMRYVKYGFAAAVLLLAAHYLRIAAGGLRGYAESQGVYDYTHFDQAYEKAKATGRPVVVDFFASWCGSCAAMEKSTFQDPEVRRLLDRCAFLRVRVEDPWEDAAVDLLARYGVRGFPAVVVLR